MKIRSVFMAARTVAAAATVMAALAVAAPVQAQGDYPTQTIRLIVGFAPGAIADLSARQLAPRLSQELGVPVIVENRAGAAGLLANEFVARAAPDGYTVLYHDSGLVTAPALGRDLNYDYKTDLTPVGIAVSGAFFIYGSPGNPANTIEEVVSELKENPGKYFYGSSGNGVLNHIAFEMFLQATGTKANHVPYQGSGPVMVDIMANRVDLSMSSAPGVLPQYKEGLLKIYAYGGEERSPLLPDVPTISETVAPGFTAANWFGLAVPSGTEDAIVARLSEALVASTQDPDFAAAMEREGAEVVGIAGDEARDFIAKQAGTWAEVIERAGLKQ